VTMDSTNMLQRWVEADLRWLSIYNWNRELICSNRRWSISHSMVTRACKNVCPWV